MLKSKIILTVFAVFASFLMLMTTTIAGPIQEDITFDSIEQKQQELSNSIEVLVSSIENDREINKLAAELEGDRELLRIKSSMEQTDDVNEKVALAIDYLSVLKSKPAYDSLAGRVDSKYSEDLSCITDQSCDLSKCLESCIVDDTESEDEYDIVEAIPFPGFVYSVTGSDDTPGVPCSSTNMGSVNAIITSSGSILLASDSYYVTPLNDDGSGYVEVDEPLGAQWVSFLRNMDGDILTPDGWISPDDPNYDDWLQIEDILQNSDLTLGDIYAILCIICFFSAIITYILAFIFTVLGYSELGVILAYLFVLEYLGIFYFWSLNKSWYEDNPPE